MSKNGWALDVSGAYTMANFKRGRELSAVLGDFKGRALALGPQVAYQFTQNPRRPMSLNLRWCHEFDVKSPPEGDSVFLTVSLPLSITEKPKPAQDWNASKSPGLSGQ